MHTCYKIGERERLLNKVALNIVELEIQNILYMCASKICVSQLNPPHIANIAILTLIWMAGGVDDSRNFEQV